MKIIIIAGSLSCMVMKSSLCPPEQPQADEPQHQAEEVERPAWLALDEGLKAALLLDHQLSEFLVGGSRRVFGNVVRGVEIGAAGTQLLTRSLAQDIGSTGLVGLQNVVETAVAVSPADGCVLGDLDEFALRKGCSPEGQE